jgi:formylglycine-generating enzyme required for sulfatase activity
VPALLLVSLVVAVPDKPTGRGSKSGDTKTHADSRESFKNKIGMTLVRIRAGDFKMGSTKDEQDALLKSVDPKFKKYVRDWLDTEGPQHDVRSSKDFYMGAYPVTVGEFGQFVEDAGYKTDAERDGKGGWGYNPARKRHEGPKPQYSWRATGWKQTRQHPVVNVSWNDAVAFCRWLSKKEGKTYRLPTEAEWEYACRAGTTTRFSFGDMDANLKDYANVADRSLKERFDGKAYSDYGFMDWDDGYPFTSPVGSFKANSWGLYDMYGNVCQWCRDSFDKDYYRHSPKADPECRRGGARVLRGGSWYLDARFCRAANRYESKVPTGGVWVGFRVVLIPGGVDPSSAPAP